MIHIMLMFAVALAMVLWRESLGAALMRFVRRTSRLEFATMAVALFLLWDAMHYVHVGIGAPITSDAMALMFDLFAYPELAIGVAVALLSIHARETLQRVVANASNIGRLVMRTAGRARRTRPAAKPRRAPPPDEPDPAWAFA